jgi:hypothetical protein
MMAMIPRRLLSRSATVSRLPHSIPETRLVYQAPRYYETCRHASNSSKPKVLEKPLKFNPPSHAARRVAPRQYPGPPLPARELEAQKTKQYPNMMPPEGSFMHWFLTNRFIHMWIILVALPST